MLSYKVKSRSDRDMQDVGFARRLSEAVSQAKSRLEKIKKQIFYKTTAKELRLEEGLLILHKY